MSRGIAEHVRDEAAIRAARREVRDRDKALRAARDDARG